MSAKPQDPIVDFRFDGGSFRDATNRVFHHDGAVYRALRSQAVEDWKALEATGFFSRFSESGKLIGTVTMGDDSDLSPIPPAGYEIVLKHTRVPFISYPYEWTFGMLKDGALLHLDLLLAALEEKMILKDSSAFNIQWQGAQPVFIDISSFERYRPGTPWAGYRQFCQMFLYPLLMLSYKGIAYHPWLRGNIEGISPKDFVRMLSLRDFFRRGVFTHCYLHAKAEGAYADTGKDLRREMRTGGFHKELIKTNAAGLRSLIQGLRWGDADSHWTGYVEECHYAEEDWNAKQEFVAGVIDSSRFDLVWDLGCNTGVFSRMAARRASYVVAMDSDHLCVERFYRELKSEADARILPMVGSVTDPPPNLGWRGRERRSLPERGKPDLILALALIHHVAIGSNVPVNEFVEWLAELQANLIIEFVTKQDPMVGRLLRHKEDIYADYTIDHFESKLAEHYSIERRQELSCRTRVLYYARVRPRMVRSNTTAIE